MTPAIYPVREIMPRPLRAIAFRDARGQVVIVMAAGLAREQQNDAAKAAACAAHKAKWLSLGPLPGLLAGAGRHARPRVAHAVHAGVAAAGGTAAVITAAAVTLTVTGRPAITREPVLPAATASPHGGKSRRPPAARRANPPVPVPAAGGTPSPAGLIPGLLPGASGLVQGTVRSLPGTVRGALSPVEQLHLKLGLQAAGVNAGVSVTPQPSPSLLPQVCVTVLGTRVCTQATPAA